MNMLFNNGKVQNGSDRAASYTQSDIISNKTMACDIALNALLEIAQRYPDAHATAQQAWIHARQVLNDLGRVPPDRWGRDVQKIDLPKAVPQLHEISELKIRENGKDVPATRLVLDASTGKLKTQYNLGDDTKLRAKIEGVQGDTIIIKTLKEVPKKVKPKTRPKYAGIGMKKKATEGKEASEAKPKPKAKAAPVTPPKGWKSRRYGKLT